MNKQMNLPLLRIGQIRVLNKISWYKRKCTSHITIQNNQKSMNECTPSWQKATMKRQQLESLGQKGLF